MANNKKHKHRKKNMRQSIILWLKGEFENIDVKIMTHVLTLVILICIVAATVAWFAMSPTAKMSGLNLAAADVTDIEISLSDTEWKNVGQIYTGDGEDALTVTTGFNMKMPAFSNIYDSNGTPVVVENANILAPGTYGTMTFYVKSVNARFTSCQISVDKIFNIIDGIDKETEEGRALYTEVAALMDGHILCFGTRSGSAGSYVYTDYLSEDNQISVELPSVNEPVPVTIYWVWPYEYEDLTNTTVSPIQFANIYSLPDITGLTTLSDTSGIDVKEGEKLATNQIFEWSRYNEVHPDYLTADEGARVKLLSDLYDYADTLIGNNVTDLSFHVAIKGVQ